MIGWLLSPTHLWDAMLLMAGAMFGFCAAIVLLWRRDRDEEWPGA